MWRICGNHGVSLWIFRFGPQQSGHRCSQSLLDKLLYNHESRVNYKLVFTMPKTRLLHPKHYKDKIPQEYSLIYENRIWRIIVPGRILTTVASLATAVLSFGHVLNILENQDSWNLYAVSGICIFSLFMTVFVNVMFRLYLLRIYFSKDNSKFIGVYNSFFGNVKHIKYSVADLQAAQHSVTDSVHVKCNIQVGGRNFHLRGRDFVVPKYYNMHIGLK